MKRNSINGRYRRKLFWNIIKSGIIAVIAVILLLLFFRLMITNMQIQGYDVSFFQITGFNSYMMIFLFVLAGIVIFMATFWYMHKANIRYLEQIGESMKEISEGNLKHTIAVTGDDELTLMAQELNSMAEDIKQLMDQERAAERSKNELVTNVAHDLRTPLTSIRGYIDLLDKNPDLDRDTRMKYTKIALDKTKRLQDLIEELFGFTKMSYGKVSVKPVVLDLVKLLEQLSDEFYPTFEANHLAFEFHSDVRSIMMTGDGMLLARLFANLINNAVKYGSDGKMIKVHVAYEEPLVTVKVINYGQIIPQDKLDKIFDKFYRVENSRASQTGGTGLGLAIARNITQLHGGTISVRSDLDGTVFTVCLRTDHDFEKEDFIGVDDL